MPKRKPKRPADVNALAAAIVGDATGEKPWKDPHAVALGKKGGRIGGTRRAANMTPEQRKEAARKAAAARWKETKGTKPPIS